MTLSELHAVERDYCCFSFIAQCIRPLRIQNDPYGDRFCAKRSDMNIQDICNQHWYLALYITGGRNREKLFDWLSDLDVTAWTPMTLTKIPRSDKPHVFRKRVSAVFPGYFFLKANFDFHNINKIRMHSAFCDFVKLGRQIAPVSPTVVDALMKVYPDPAFHPAARTERESASDVWLTKQQYQHLMHIDSTAHPVSRIAMLLDLINHPESHGY